MPGTEAPGRTTRQLLERQPPPRLVQRSTADKCQRAIQVGQPGIVSGADTPAHAPLPGSLMLWPGPSATRLSLIPKYTPTWKAICK